MSILSFNFNTKDMIYGFQLFNFPESNRSLIGFVISKEGILINILFVNTGIF